MRTKIEITLREQQVTITDVRWCPAEPDVGIMSSYIDDYTLKDEKGNILDWELTNAEFNQVNEEILKYRGSYYEEDFP